MHPKRGFLFAVLLVFAFAACSSDDDPIAPVDPPPPPPPPPPAALDFAFTYDPPDGAGEIEAISVPGDHNDWDCCEGNALHMELQEDGTWLAEIELEPGEYEYKYWSENMWPDHGGWAQNMCDDEEWGDPDNEFWLSPEADECVDDGFGGFNAKVTIEP